jgi:hypothetical protein
MEIDFNKPVDFVDSINPKEFKEKYLLPEKPLVISKLWKDYPAITKWTMDYFKENLGDIKIGLFSDEENYLDRSFKHPHQFMNFGDYLDLIATKPTNLRIFLFNIFKYKPDLKNDFEFPKISSGFLKRFSFLFFGGQNSKVRMHQDMDMSNVFLTQLRGSKKVILFSPEFSELLYRIPFTVHSGVDIENPDYEKFPGLRFVRGFQCTISNGETLFIPSGWWHYITYLEGGYAISLRALSPHFYRQLEGFWKLIILSTLDDILRAVIGKPWFNYKMRLTEKRARKAITKINQSRNAKASIISSSLDDI